MRPIKEENRFISTTWPYRVLVVAVLFVALLDSTHVRAAARRCGANHLEPAERDDVLHRARRVVPRDAGSLFLDSACWNRDSASAWFRTPTVVDPDGVHWWWVVRCERDTRSWSCDPAKRQRRIEVSVADVEKPAALMGSFPDNMSTSRAKAILVATATLVMNAEMPLPPCTRGSDDANRWIRARSNLPTPDLDYPAAEVDVASTGVIVDYRQSLRFQFDKDDQSVCWDELVIVD